MKTKMLLTIILVGVTCLAVYGKTSIFTQREDSLAERRKTRGDERQRREQEKTQQMQKNQQIRELEDRIQDIEHALMPYWEPPSSLIDSNSNDAVLYKAAYMKSQHEARVRLMTKNAVRAANRAGIRFKENKEKKITEIWMMMITEQD